MKDIWKAVYTKLKSDATLTTMLGFDASTNQNIYLMNPQQSLIGSHTKALIYGRLIAERMYTGNDTHKIRRYFITLTSLDKENDLNCSDVLERAIEVLDNHDISIDNFHCYSCYWDAFTTPIHWDEENKVYRQDCRFRIVARKD